MFIGIIDAIKPWRGYDEENDGDVLGPRYAHLGL